MGGGARESEPSDRARSTLQYARLRSRSHLRPHAPLSGGRALLGPRHRARTRVARPLQRESPPLPRLEREYRAGRTAAAAVAGKDRPTGPDRDEQIGYAVHSPKRGVPGSTPRTVPRLRWERYRRIFPLQGRVLSAEPRATTRTGLQRLGWGRAGGGRQEAPGRRGLPRRLRARLRRAGPEG